MNMQWKLRRHAIALVRLATFVAKVSGRRVKVPHKWVTRVTNRSWLCSLDGKRWVPVRIDSMGRVLS